MATSSMSCDTSVAASHSVLPGWLAVSLQVPALTMVTVAPETVQTLSHTHSILALVDANVGIALVPRSSMKLRYANVCFRPIAHVTGIEMVMPLSNEPSPNSSSLRSVLVA